MLGRSRRLLEPVVEALKANGVPSYVAMRKDEFISHQMIWLHSVLRLANARQEREQLRRLCKSFFELAGVNLHVRDIISNAPAVEGDYLRAWQRTALGKPQLDAQTRRFLERNIPILSDKLDFWTFIDDALKWFNALPNVGPNQYGNESDFTEESYTWHELAREVQGNRV